MTEGILGDQIAETTVDDPNLIQYYMSGKRIKGWKGEPDDADLDANGDDVGSLDRDSDSYHSESFLKETKKTSDCWKCVTRVATNGAISGITYLPTAGRGGRGKITGAPDTLSGVSLLKGYRIFIKDEVGGVGGEANGPWEVKTLGTGSDGVWVRTQDFFNENRVSGNAIITVGADGTATPKTGWMLDNVTPFTIGGASGDVLTFTQIFGVGAGGLVTSVFGRTGTVVSLLSDYDASQIDNDSSITGTTVKAALETLDASKAAATHGSLHVEFAADAVPNATGSVGGIMSAVDKTKLDGIASGAQVNVVLSVFGRTGTITAAVSDYDASQVDNDSGVTGTTVKDALDQLAADIVTATEIPIADNNAVVKGSADATKLLRFEIDGLSTATTRTITMPDKDVTLDDISDTRTPTVHASTHTNGSDDIQDATASQKGLATATQITKLDGIAVGADVSPVASVFGRIGSVVSTLSDYDASQVDNDSGVTGATVKDALDTLDSAAALFAVPVSTDKDLTSAVTTGDNSPTGITIASTPTSNSHIKFVVNGQWQNVGDGVKTKDVYFSTDGGATALALSAVTVGAQAIWNGVIATFELDAADEIDLDYDKAA